MKANFDFKAKALLISAITVLTSIGLIMYGMFMVRSFVSIEEIWVKHQKSHSAYISALNNIRRHLGYGGFIHNYKNFIIRRDKRIIKVIDKNKIDVMNAIQDYKELGLTNEEEAALISLEKVLDRYAINYEKAKIMISEGRPVTEVDMKTQVDDWPALDAIELLTKMEIEEAQENKKKTIELLNKTMEKAYWGLSFIVVILLAGLIVLYYMRKVVRSNQKIKDVSYELNKLIESAPDSLLIVNSKGLIVQSNKQASVLFKYTEADMKGMPVEQLVPERFRERHIKQREQYIEHPHYRVVGEQDELFAVDKNNTEIPVEIALNYIERDGETIVISEIRDITERKAREEQLRLQKIILDEMAEGVNLVDVGGNIIYTNPRFNEIFGYQDGELIGKHAVVLNATSDAKHAKEAAEEILHAVESEGYWTGEVHNIKKNGEEFWTWANVSRTTHNEHGEILVTVQHDVSNEKKIKQELEESREFVSTVVASLEGNIAVIDKQGTIIAVNQAWEDFALKNDSGSLQYVNTGNNYLATCEKAAKNDHDAIAQNVLAGIHSVLDGTARSFSAEYPCHSATVERWFNMVVTPLKRAAGGAVISHHNITKAVAAQEALRKNETNLKLITDSVPALIAYIDNDLTYQYVNKSFENWFGLSRESILGNKARDILGENVINELKDYLMRALNSEKVTLEKRLHFKFGPARYVSIAFIPDLDDKGKVAGFFAIVNDITRRHEEEKSRIEHERKQKDTLVREIHHRIKNNLQSVVGLLRRESKKHKALRPYFEEAIGQVNAISLVHGIQGLSQLKQISIDKLLENIVQSICEVTNATIGALQCNAVEAEVCITEEEAVPIALIVNELLTNAIKHGNQSNPGSDITLSLSGGNAGVIFQVQNAGKKLPESFDFKLNKGLGMGLTLVKSLLPEHGASVSVTQTKSGVLSELVISKPVLYVSEV